jgi:hypothetical protein
MYTVWIIVFCFVMSYSLALAIKVSEELIRGWKIWNIWPDPAGSRVYLDDDDDDDHVDGVRLRL